MRGEWERVRSHMSACVRACVYDRCVRMHTCIYMRTRVCPHMYAHICKRMGVCPHMYAYARMPTYAQARMHMVHAYAHGAYSMFSIWLSFVSRQEVGGAGARGGRRDVT